MRKVLSKTVVLCAAVFALVSTGNSQTIVCDGQTCPGSGNFSGAAPCPSLDYMYMITDPHPEVPESVYIGTHDGNIAHYKNVCMPAGWSFSIVPAQNVHFSSHVLHGTILTGTNGACPFYLSFSGLMAPGSVYIGFDHDYVPHEVSWELGTLGANVSVNWTDAVASGTGPVHGPFACDSMGTILYGDGDCNDDGIVLTVGDLTYLNSFLHGGTAPPTELYHSDLNGDCVVDSLDLILYQNYFTFGISVFDPYGGYPVPTCCSVRVVFYPPDPLGDICGVKFDDVDCDSVWDATEPGISGWQIYLYQGTTPVGGPAITNANGEYCFLNLTPGIYRVREASQPGWIQTRPATNAYFNVNVVAGQTTQNIDFGNTRDTCPPPSTLKFVTLFAGKSDNFSTADGPEPSSPQLGVGGDMEGACFNTPNHFFDANQSDNCFGHTFTGFNQDDSCCVIGAELCFYIMASASGSQTDGIWIVENGGTAWFLSMHDLISWYTFGVDTSWTVGDIIDTCIDLANTPLPGYMGLTHAMAALHDGDLSVMIQDDTKIDYLQLNVTLCCPRQDADTLGVCCLPDGSCVPAVSANQCQAMQGTFTLGGSCIPNPCPQPDSGVCCYNGTCTQVHTAGECDSLYGGLGTFIANGSCFPNPCPPEPDSCETFTVKCCDGKPESAQRETPNFKGQVAVASCYTDPTLITDPPYVVGIVDLTTQCTAPLGTSANPMGFITPMFHNELSPVPMPATDPNEWTRRNLGTVFALTLDTLGNIYVAQTSCYNTDDFSNFYGNGNGGDVYKLGTTNGNISLATRLLNSGQGLGDVSYQCRGDILFVSNMEDGLIYPIQNISSVTPTMGIPYDHGVDGRTDESLLPLIPDDGVICSPSCPNSNTGFTERGRRIWALQAVNGILGSLPFSRLYYSVWWEDLGNIEVAEQNEIWSVGLDLTTGNILPGTARREIKLPPLPGASTSAPVSDISFTTDGHMILAERSMNSGTTSAAHNSRLLSYKCENGLWTRETPTSDIYQIALFGSPSCAGGTDYDAKTPYPAACVAGRVWATGDALQGLNIYGLAGFPKAGGNVSNNLTCILIDLDGNISAQDKTEIGDVEVPCRHCKGIKGDVNSDLSDANILDLTFLVDRIFRGGPPPHDLEEADVHGDGDGAVNILDLTFMVDRIFRGGPAPVACPQCCRD